MPWAAAWQPLVADPYQVLAQPAGLWTPVLDFVEGPCLLKIIVAANNLWSYAPTASCGPDGDPSSLLLSDRCLFADAPVGALIAKVGGSSAGWKDGSIALVGRTAVIPVAAPGGPLYLTINDERTGMGNNSGFVRVLIWRSDAPPAAAVAAPAAPPGEPPAANAEKTTA
jgi:hypothetical protein